MRHRSLLLLFAVTACVEAPREAELEQHADPPPTPAGACKLVFDPKDGVNIATTPHPALPNIEAAVGNWVGANCPPNFHSTPRDVTCAFKSKVENAKAGQPVTVQTNDWPFGDYHEWVTKKLEYFDDAGKLLGTKTTPIDPAPPTKGHYAKYMCKVPCTGSLSGTLATAEITGATAPGVPPGVIPKLGDNPAGKSFCQTYQAQLTAKRADCALGRATTEWDGYIGGTQTTPWKLAEKDKTKSETRAVKAGAIEAYPTCVKIVETITYNLWTASLDDMKRNCAAVFAASTQAERDKACEHDVYRDTFKSVVRAQICVPDEMGPGGPGPQDPDDGSGEPPTPDEPTPGEPTTDVIPH